MILAIRCDQRQRGKPFDDPVAAFRAGESLQQFLQHKAGQLEQRAFDSYHAWFGRFTVGPDGDTVVHHIEASLFPNWERARPLLTAGDRRRSYTPANAATALRSA